MAAGGATASADGAGWVGTTLDGPGNWALRGRIPYILGLMMLFDSWDSVVIAYTLPSITSEWGLSPLNAGWLLSSGYAGQFLGALAFGTLAERVGRLPVIRALVLIMSVLAIACALAQDFTQLFVIRFIQGLAIGGALPVTICYINEVAPTATRGKFFGTFQFIFAAGFGLAAMSSAWIVPNLGWHAMFAVGAIPMLFVPLLYLLPESPRWLAGQRRLDEAAAALVRLGSAALPKIENDGGAEQGKVARVPISDLFAPGIRRKWAVIASLWFLTYFVSYGLVNWVPSIYVSVFDIPISEALTYTSIGAVAMFFLPLVLRQIMDKVGRRPPAYVGMAVGGVAMLAMMAVPGETWLLAVCLLIIGQIGIAFGALVLWPYTAEIFETRVRAVALGASSSLARAASMLTPLVVGGLLQVMGSVTLVFLIFGVASLIVVLLWWYCTTETAGRELGA